MPGTAPNSALGKALGYAHPQWPKLVRHLDHPEIPVDNNYSEQQIKHFATGRKAWLFSYDASSAQASANLFSLVTTCRVNDVEPYAYLNYLLEHLPACYHRRAHRGAAAVEPQGDARRAAPEISAAPATVRGLTRRSPTAISRKIPVRG